MPEERKELADAIKKIISKEFKGGDLFDSHAVIGLLRSPEYGNVYYTCEEADKYKISQTKNYHSEISRMIRDSGLVEDAGGGVKVAECEWQPFREQVVEKEVTRRER